MFKLNNQQDKVNKTLFQHKTIETVSKPKDEKFFKTFFKSNKVTFLIGVVGQILSAVTEFIFVFLATGGELPLFQKQNIISIMTGLFVVYVFEWLGIRVYLVRIVRQIVSKDYDKTERKVLLFFNILFCGSILFANFFTSIKGQETSFMSIKSEVDDSQQKASFDSLKLAKIAEIQAKYKALNDDLTTKADNEKATINQTFDSSIKSLERSKWVEGSNKASLNNQINSKNTEREKKINTVDDRLNKSISSNDELKNEEIETIRNSTNNSKNNISNKSEAYLYVVSIIEKYSLVLLILFMSLSVLAIIYNEVFNSGSEQEIELKEVKKDPNLIIAFLLATYLKVYHFFYWLIALYAGNKAYNHSKIIQEKTDYLSSDANINLRRIRRGKQPKIAARKTAGFTAQKQLQPVAVQNKTSVSDATKNAVLDKYNFNTVASWYKRSNLIGKSLSKDEKTQAKNAEKYLKAKQELQNVGVRFIERKNNVTIKL